VNMTSPALEHVYNSGFSCLFLGAVRFTDGKISWVGGLVTVFCQTISQD